MSDLSREDTNTSLSTPSTGGKKRKPKSRVSFKGEEATPLAPPTRAELMRRELEKMRRRDEEEDRRQREYKSQEVARVRAQIEAERLAKGIQLVSPQVNEKKWEIKRKLDKEIQAAMHEERSKLAVETDRMKNAIGHKHGLLSKKKANIVKLAEEFAKPNKAGNALGLPDRIVRELTMEEIMDLKTVFGMFDVAGLGYIRRKDIQRVSGMLAFPITKDQCKEMIDDLCGNDSNKVNFVQFLDFVIRNQEGSDPFEEVQQCFRLLDRDEKGFLNFDDIRTAADEVGCRLSNRMIREMLDDADTSGDAEIGPDEFLMMMLRTSAFTL